MINKINSLLHYNYLKSNLKHGKKVVNNNRYLKKLT